jgi:hypothetical protein
MHTDVFLRIDAVVDHYFLALEKYGAKVEILQMGIKYQ